MPKHTLLIVDDVPENVSVLYRLFSNLDFKVLVAQDGDEAIQRVEYTKPDLILLDIMMPGLTGFDVCRILKQNSATQHIPVIFMTALTDSTDKVKGFSLGAVDYITKPFQHDEVLSRVTTHLHLRNLQRQLEHEILARKAYIVDLEKRNVELNTFARTVAHDLKNPLTGVIGFSDLLIHSYPLNSTVDSKALRYFDLLLQSGHKMLDIIDALLLFARSAQPDGCHDLSINPLNMSDIIHEVTQHRLSLMIHEFRGEIILPKFWHPAFGYAPWIEEVWANYLSNGLKYGGQPPRLVLGSNPVNNDITRFWIHDNGLGLSEVAQAKLFTPFTRLEKERASGYGLGLSIVQQIVEKLHGHVGIESKENQGCTFYFTLPTHPLEIKII